MADTRSLVFIDDVTTDITSRKNSEVYRAISAQIQPHYSKLIGFTVQMDNDLILQKQPKTLRQKSEMFSNEVKFRLVILLEPS